MHFLTNVPVPIINGAHGGIIGGHYQTGGKRSPRWSDGRQLFEGEFNRAVKTNVFQQLYFKGIPYYDLTPEQKDISRLTRVGRANLFHKKKKGRTFLIDIHANAGGGHGSEVFIAKNASENSRALANWFKMLYGRHFPESHFRGVKHKNWDLVHLTNMPAVLLECFFMDNEQECRRYLMTREGRDRIAAWIVAGIENYIKFHQ